jgi:DNA-binding SARP family transcriptional activator/predicted ATPase
MDEGLRLILLGEPQVSRNGAPVTGFIYNKALALLVYLAVTRRPHSREALAGLFWGEMPDAAAKANLRKILSTLREVAGPELVIDRQTVAIDPAAAVWLDTQVIEARLSQIRRGHDPSPRAQPANILPENDVRQIEDAVGLYRGDFLEGFYVRSAPAFEEWVLSERERLRQMALYGLYRLVSHYTAGGDYGQGLDYATRLLSLEPWHEEVHQQMMLLLALSGQRSAAIDQFETCRRLLADELGAEPNRDTVDLYRRIVRGELSPQKRHASLPRDWPAETTPFVGRATELARLAAFLGAPDRRLATVAGISGVGKTRLILQAAAQAMRISGQAVVYVSLTATSTPEAISHAGLRALALPPTSQRTAVEQLIGHLRNRALLMVLDHLDVQPGILGFLQNLMQHAPGVRLLVATSSRLNLAGEWVMPLYGLQVPESDSPDQILRSDAVQLFIQTAQRACGVCSFEEDQLAHIARISRLVEGMPLAIELAAAWSRLLSFRDIAQEIETNYRFLTSSGPAVQDRHNSLTAAFDYSWALMSAEERALAERLSVFRGSFAREAAEQVTGASLPALSALMDKCIIQRTLAGRYQAHRLLSQYGRQKLAQEPQEETRIHERYCDYYTRFLQRQMELLKNEGGDRVLSEISAEQENLEAAWRWAAGAIRTDSDAPADAGSASQRFVAAKTALDTTNASTPAPVRLAERAVWKSDAH